MASVAQNVRCWPKADIPSCAAHVRFRGILSSRLFVNDHFRLLTAVPTLEGTYFARWVIWER